MCLYEFDRAIINKEGIKILAGIDEVGRGPLAGPVVASAVILNLEKKLDGINDSKKLNKNERVRLYDLILQNAIDIGIGIVDAHKIDSINILNATKLAMTKAISELKIKPEFILIDALELSSIKINQRAIIKGDEKSASIAAASIIAKITRDRIMTTYHERYPQYGFDKNKGYPTKEHIYKLSIHGFSPIHRKSFRGVCSNYLLFDLKNKGMI